MAEEPEVEEGEEEDELAAPASTEKLVPWGSPLPPPELLQEYEKRVPGSAQRIMMLAEREQYHRHKREYESKRLDKIISLYALIPAYVATITLTVGVLYTAFADDISVGVALAGAIAVGMIFQLLLRSRNHLSSSQKPDDDTRQESTSQ